MPASAPSSVIESGFQATLRDGFTPMAGTAIGALAALPFCRNDPLQYRRLRCGVGGHGLRRIGFVVMDEVLDADRTEGERLKAQFGLRNGLRFRCGSTKPPAGSESDSITFIGLRRSRWRRPKYQRSTGGGRDREATEGDGLIFILAYGATAAPPGFRVQPEQERPSSLFTVRCSSRVPIQTRAFSWPRFQIPWPTHSKVSFGV